MRQTILAAFGAAMCAIAFAAPAHAQATRTWVSGVGDDVNPCSRTAPCKTFAGAISKTAINGEINCLDPGGYGTVTITKSITLDCRWTQGSILASGTDGINISIAPNANDPLRTVRLRGLSINGAGSSGTVGTRTGVNGIDIISASAVFVEGTIISDFSTRGIWDHRTDGQTRLYVTDSVIRSIGGPGIVAAATGTNIVVLDNLRSENNMYGVATGSSNNVVANRSVFSGNLTAGVEVDVGGQVNVMGSVMSHNGIGVQAPGTAWISDSTVAFNNNAVTGTVTTFGNNRIVGNVALGGTLSPAGGPTSDLGQQ